MVARVFWRIVRGRVLLGCSSQLLDGCQDVANVVWLVARLFLLIARVFWMVVMISGWLLMCC